MNKIFIFWFLFLSNFAYADQASIINNNVEQTSEHNTININNIIDNVDRYYSEDEINIDNSKTLSNNNKDDDLKIEENQTQNNKKEIESKVNTNFNAEINQNSKRGLNKKIGIETDYKYKDFTLSGQIDLNVKSNKKKKKKKKKQKSKYNPKVGINLDYDF
jgi:hypothetical protein